MLRWSSLAGSAKAVAAIVVLGISPFSGVIVQQWSARNQTHSKRANLVELTDSGRWMPSISETKLSAKLDPP
jgi:hypothetical protein